MGVAVESRTDPVGTEWHEGKGECRIALVIQRRLAQQQEVEDSATRGRPGTARQLNCRCSPSLPEEDALAKEGVGIWAGPEVGAINEVTAVIEGSGLEVVDVEPAARCRLVERREEGERVRGGLRLRAMRGEDTERGH